jgi:hypothetical protein
LFRGCLGWRRDLLPIILFRHGHQSLEIKYGALLLKDYAKVGAFDERDYLESKLVFPTTLFEGHALAMKL